MLIIVGTRPEIIRLAAVINKCRTYFDTLLAHTGQNYDYNLNGVFFKDLKLADPDIYMEAGNRCKDECLPEETNRRIVDIISDVNRRQAERNAMAA